MRYAWIDQQRDCYPLKLLCRVLQVARSGYYAWRRREPSRSAQRRQQIGQAAQESHRDSHGTTAIGRCIVWPQRDLPAFDAPNGGFTMRSARPGGPS